MKILNFSSMDHEKGLNQSIALANAGAKVYHAGRMNRADGDAVEKLRKHGVRILPVEDIPLKEALHGVLAQFGDGDFLLVQNGLLHAEQIVRMAKGQGMTVAFNPSPFTREIFNYPLEYVDIFVINEREGYQMTGEAEAEYIVDVLQEKYPKVLIVLTLGERGVCCLTEDRLIMQKVRKVEAVDPAGAGDTFIGYFLAEYQRSGIVEAALALAARAASLAVSRPGAADSIPRLEEVNGR